MNILEEELRLMDRLPRRQAYLSMFILGAGLGVTATILINLIVAVIPFAVAFVILLSITSPLK